MRTRWLSDCLQPRIAKWAVSGAPNLEIQTSVACRNLGGRAVMRIGVLVLLLLWVLGLYTGRTMGGFVHVLLVLAVILGLISLVRGKN